MLTRKLGLAADLKRHLNHEPVVARPPSNVYRLQKMVRRNKLAFAAAGAVTAAMLLGLGASTWLFIREAKAHRQAMAAERKQSQLREAAQTAEANEVQQRQRAEENAILLKIQRAEDFFASDNASAALAFLAQVLRENPTNRVAAQRLISALTLRNFPLPVTEPLQHDDELFFAELTPDGQRAVTASKDGTARVWDAKTGRPLTPPLRHNGAVVTARFSPDGKRVVTGSFDKTAQVWNALDGRALTGPLQHNYVVHWVQFSPDGSKVATAARYDPGSIWDSVTGQRLSQPLKHANSLKSVTFSPDGHRVLSTSADGTAKVWDVDHGQILTEVNHGGFIICARFSPEGERFVTASTDNTARVWDARTGQPVTGPLQHETSVIDAAFSPDGQRIVTHSRDNVARVWDAQTGQPLTHPFQYRAGVPSMSAAAIRWHWVHFTPDGLGILTASWDNSARLWDSRTGQPLIEPLRHDQETVSAELSSDGRQVITASVDKTARVWDVRAGYMMTEPLAHNGEVTVAQFSPDGQRVITASEDRTAWIWDVRTARPVVGPLRHDDFILGVQFSSDGQRVATASCDHTARVWDAQTGQPLTGLLWHDDSVRSIQFSRDACRVVTASDDGTARVWDARSGQLLAGPFRHETNVVGAAFSPDGKKVVTASWDKTARVWDTTTGAEVTRSLTHRAEVLAAAFSPDGEQVITASADHTARIWSARTGQPSTEPLQHDDRVLSAEFSPDGKLAVTASAGKTARIWDTRTGRSLSDSLRHRETVNTARFSPDGRWVVTASADYTARVWDAQSGQPVTDFFRHDDAINSAQFSSDSHRIVTASADQTARVWELPAVSLPVPEWLPRLAEALAGQRYTAQGFSQPVPVQELLKLKSRILGSTASDSSTRWAKWFFADRSDRTISPDSAVTVSEYVRRRLELPPNYLVAAVEPDYVPGYVRNQSRQNVLKNLEEALRLAPANHLALARLARNLSADLAIRHPSRTGDADWYGHKYPRLAGEADWYSRRAIELAPDDLEARWSRAEVLARSGQLGLALEKMDGLLEQQPNNPEFWNAKGQMLELTNRFDLARQAYTRAIDLASAQGNAAKIIRDRARLSRCDLLRRQQHTAEARADLLAAKAELLVPVTIPPRDPRLRPDLINLAPCMDVLLTDTWMWWPGATKRCDIGALPRGVRTLAGVEFDLRGYARLRPATDPISKQEIGDEVAGIAVGQRCTRIHFLHSELGAGGSSLETMPPFGKQLGKYLIHYADGQQQEAPIRFRVDLSDFVEWAPEPNAQSVTAWAGTNERVKSVTGYKSIRIFKSTWENPRPDVEIKSIDAVATHCELLLFAITVDSR